MDAKRSPVTNVCTGSRIVAPAFSARATTASVSPQYSAIECFAGAFGSGAAIW